MVLHIVFLILATASSGCIYYFTGLYNNYWWLIFFFILAIPLLYIIWFFIYLIPISFVSLFLSKKKEVKKPNMKTMLLFILIGVIEVLLILTVKRFL